jgi:hypothetical protein
MDFFYEFILLLLDVVSEEIRFNYMEQGNKHLEERGAKNSRRHTAYGSASKRKVCLCGGVGEIGNSCLSWGNRQ